MRQPLDSLAGRKFDVVILGGGINGASAAQHISAAGYDVLLVEKEDFGSGSSSRSSRNMHCGLRYLMPGRSILDFVRHPSRFFTALRMAGESMRGRSEFVRTSALRARPMQFCYPIYRDGPYRGWQVDAAFRLLSLFENKDVPLGYHRLGPKDFHRFPLASHLANAGALDSLAVFQEYQFDWPERICLDCLMDAERLGATVRNYTKGRIGARTPDGRWRVELSDELAEGAQCEVEADIVLNLTGIWIDETNRAAVTSPRRRIQGTKGSHIVVKLPDDCAGMGMVTVGSNNEPFFCQPWHDLHFLGPTETLYDGDREDVHVTAEERAWLLEETNRVFPGLSLRDADIVSTWAGIRPLTYDEAVPFGNRSRQIHDLESDGMPNVLAMTAGPLMSHRSGGRIFAETVGKRLSPRRPAQEVSYAPHVAAEPRNAPRLVAEEPGVTLDDVRRAVNDEHAITLMDVLYRRTGLGWRRNFTEEEVRKAAEVLRMERNLSPREMEEEVSAFQSQVKHLFQPRDAEQRRKHAAGSLH